MQYNQIPIVSIPIQCTMETFLLDGPVGWVLDNSIPN